MLNDDTASRMVTAETAVQPRASEINAEGVDQGAVGTIFSEGGALSPSIREITAPTERRRPNGLFDALTDPENRADEREDGGDWVTAAARRAAAGLTATAGLAALATTAAATT